MLIGLSRNQGGIYGIICNLFICNVDLKPNRSILRRLLKLILDTKSRAIYSRVAKSNLLLNSNAIWEDASAEYLNFCVFEVVSGTQIIGFDQDASNLALT